MRSLFLPLILAAALLPSRMTSPSMCIFSPRMSELPYCKPFHATMYLISCSSVLCLFFSLSLFRLLSSSFSSLSFSSIFPFCIFPALALCLSRCVFGAHLLSPSGWIPSHMIILCSPHFLWRLAVFSTFYLLCIILLASPSRTSALYPRPLQFPMQLRALPYLSRPPLSHPTQHYPPLIAFTPWLYPPIRLSLCSVGWKTF